MRRGNPAGLRPDLPDVADHARVQKVGEAHAEADSAHLHPPPATTGAGIRHLRIERPRIGEKFIFTKVLNVGDETLKIETLAVASKVLYTFRSLSQLTVFLAGLLLLWWQLRRARVSIFSV